MELALSGNALRSFNRSITCLARVGTELVLQASPSKLELHTLNSSRTAYETISFKPDFFDVYSLSSSSIIQCSVLLKSVCSILRTPVASIDRLSALLPSPDSPKLQWSLHCLNGVRKMYWISCNVEPEIQQLSLDRWRFPSNLVVRPRDLARLLANFQSSLQEITVIATEPLCVLPDDGGDIGGKAVELRSYIDPTKDNSDSALHTQLWIDPAEEFLQYTHVGDPVDVTFGVKELKAFLSFCEGCEVDIHLFFDKAGEPILMAPRFGFDDGSNSDFDATLVLATMLVSQLHEVNTADHPSVAQGPQSQRAKAANASTVEHPSDHTKIWSDLSGSAARSSESTRERQAQMERNPSFSMQNGIQRTNAMNVSPPAQQNAPIQQPMETDHANEPQDRAAANVNSYSQHHLSNWVGAGDNEEEEDEDEMYVQSTPHYDD
uniref:Cell cycle checkpoint control protein RAD9A n=1 Tax=Elaeis guineensis var. tenera TaxID=51953 RepID=A0A6I9S6N6_ELAGV|nr:cell cycle checkpoint control protein RAD9A [Elaeis guineensis]